MLLWDQSKGYVMPAMLANLLVWSLIASAATVAPSDELPSGSGEAFRERMLNWSAPAEPVAPVAKDPLENTAGAPIRLPRLSSAFGYRGDPLGGGRRMHSGIDIPGRLGTPIQASADGTVDFAGAAGGYGRMVEISHPGGLATRYAHLSQILVVPGMTVRRGQTIALMGSTGRSTGSHLHFEVRQRGQAANPLAFLGGPYAAVPEPAYRGWTPQTEPVLSDFARARATAQAAHPLAF